MSIRLQISEQRKNILLSYLQIRSMGPAGVWTRSPGRQSGTLPTELTGQTDQKKTEKRDRWFSILLLHDYAIESAWYTRVSASPGLSLLPLTLNPGVALTLYRTTRPWWLNWFRDRRLPMRMIYLWHSPSTTKRKAERRKKGQIELRTLWRWSPNCSMKLLQVLPLSLGRVSVHSIVEFPQ